MKIQGTVKVIENKAVMGSDNVQKYYIECEEGDGYKSTFRFTTKDPTIAAAAKVGGTYIFSGYIDGKKVLQYKNAAGEMVDYRFPRFESWLKLTKVEDRLPSTASVSPSIDPQPVDEAASDDDLPF